MRYSDRFGLRANLYWKPDNGAGDQGAITPEAEEPKKEEHKTFDEAYVKELRQENAKYRTERNALQQRLEALEAAQKQREESELTEQQKWQQLAEKRAGELEKLSQQLKAMEVNVKRVKVAAEFNLNVVIDEDTKETLADRLRGDTEEELRADAKKLAKLLKPVTQATEPPDKSQPEPEKDKPAEQVARSQNTTAVPGGQPVGKTDADRTREYRPGVAASPIFNVSDDGVRMSSKNESSGGIFKKPSS